jgi:hypothetical protein
MNNRTRCCIGLPLLFACSIALAQNPIDAPSSNKNSDDIFATFDGPLSGIALDTFVSGALTFQPMLPADDFIIILKYSDRIKVSRAVALDQMYMVRELCINYVGNRDARNISLEYLQTEFDRIDNERSKSYLMQYRVMWDQISDTGKDAISSGIIPRIISNIRVIKKNLKELDTARKGTLRQDYKDGCLKITSTENLNDLIITEVVRAGA